MSTSSFSELRVLIVDDNDHMRRLLRNILESLGVRQVRDAENGMVALNESRLNVPDVIITDMMMEPVDGLEFSRMLRDDVTHPATHIPVMMVTGHAEKQYVEAARDAGVSEFLAKPVTVDGVAARLRSVIEKPRRFIRSKSFVGPDRRRQQVPVPSEERRRAEDQRAADQRAKDKRSGDQVVPAQAGRVAVAAAPAIQGAGPRETTFHEAGAGPSHDFDFSRMPRERVLR